MYSMNRFLFVWYAFLVSRRQLSKVQWFFFIGALDTQSAFDKNFQLKTKQKKNKQSSTKNGKRSIEAKKNYANRITFLCDKSVCDGDTIHKGM